MNTEHLAQIASGQGEVWEKTRQIIGECELALLLAKAALEGTSIGLSPTKVADALRICERAARNRIDNLAVKDVMR